tara:strand:+ start:86 stop:463 length:378 start_codon:yes stop_codon:yes gene_type:complete
MKKLLNITELSKALNLIDSSNKPLNHTLRYWEKEFKQIKPKIINQRRYYPNEQVELLKFINFLLKDRKMSIKGVKIVLKSKINKLDDYNSDSLKAEYFKRNIKLKSKHLLNKIKDLKRYGKKNSY